MAVYNLSGAGTQGLSSNVTRLHVDVVTYGIAYAHGRASPTNYYDLGLLRLGVQGSYYPAVPIDASSMIVDVPAGVTTLGYSLFSGANIRVTEVIGGNFLGGARVPGMYANVQLVAGAASTTMWNYVVPSAGSALLQFVTIGFGIGTASESCTGLLYLDSQLVWAEATSGPLSTSAQGNFVWWTPSIASIQLFANEQISMVASNSGPGGSVNAISYAFIVEYPEPVW